VRRTKDASQQTRRKILVAARAEFAERGVTRTTLEHIARTAGVTRGAIYWHFANKAALFRAMRDQVVLPLVDRTDFIVAEGTGGDPLVRIEAFMDAIAGGILDDRETRETFEILNLKCEYVDELRQELTSQGKRCSELLEALAGQYRAARRAGTLRAGLAPETAALESSAFLIGLLRMALICGDRMGVAKRATELIAAHVDGRRVKPMPGARPAARKR
jgi:TetR/AcrR family acrAB operon transcriptional repressor